MKHIIKKPIINLTQTPYDDLEFMYNPSSHDEVVDLIKSKINNKFIKLVPTYTYLVKKKFYNFKIKNYEINENEYYINNKLVINYSLFDRLRIFFSKFFYI